MCTPGGQTNRHNGFTVLAVGDGREEGALAKHFGSEWVQYTARVPWKLVPGVY